MKVLFVSPEVSPLVRTGGLGDVVGSLPLSLHQKGVDVRILCPLHRNCRQVPSSSFSQKLSIILQKKRFSFSIRSTELGTSKIPVYFLENNSLFDRDGIYADENGDFADNALRAFALCKAAVELEKIIDWEADVFHAHDWMAAPACAFLNAKKKQLKRKVGSVLTIHNLEHQGVFGYDEFLASHLPKKFWGMEGFEHNGSLNLLKGGIQHADKLTTVSPTYAKEIKTVEFGCGLESSLQYRAADLTGILNGIDEKSWNPEDDPKIPFPITKTSPKIGKRNCKFHLQKSLGLPTESEIPLLGVVSRLYHQKGLDLLIEALPSLLQNSIFQLVVLGSGDPKQEEKLQNFAQGHPNQIATQIGFDDGLARNIFAGSDFFLMPSRFEPCGLAQQYAMRYGSIPIARKTGGLADTILSHSKDCKQATGFLFKEARPDEFINVILRALALFKDGKSMLKVMNNAMNSPFSWASAADRYIQVYQWSLEEKSRVINNAS